MKQPLFIVSTACSLLLSHTATAAIPYVGHDLYQLSYPNGAIGLSLGAPREGSPLFGTQGVGSIYTSNPYETQAVMWNSPTGATALLHPVSGFIASEAAASDGVSQVGFGNLVANASIEHALLWQGTAQSMIDLHPTLMPQFLTSYANGVKGNSQVGVAKLNANDGPTLHAILWQGTAESAIDLHPTNLGEVLLSIATATDGVQQVGEVVTAELESHPVLWNGSANSAVDLYSSALSQNFRNIPYGVGGGQQVGAGKSLTSHALLWSGTANSLVDLAPTNLPEFPNSEAYATNGTIQVGVGMPDYPNQESERNDQKALAWNGTGASAINLHELLPEGFTSSAAFSVDFQGNIYGAAYDSLRHLHIVQWSPVSIPEPCGFVLMAGGTLGMLCIRRQRNFCDFRNRLTSHMNG